jgi:hypothetical protein
MPLQWQSLLVKPIQSLLVVAVLVRLLSSMPLELLDGFSICLYYFYGGGGGGGSRIWSRHASGGSGGGTGI